MPPRTRSPPRAMTCHLPPHSSIPVVPWRQMTLSETMKQLEAVGSEQTRKTYRRHGVQMPMFGVKMGDLSKVQKGIKKDHALALALWATGNLDARVLATMIADPF